MRTSIRPTLRSALALLLLAALTVAAAAQERDRAKVPDKYKWNLADIYPDVAAWRAAREKLAAELPKIRSYEGKLASSPAVLADALETMSRLDKELSRLYVYASMLADQDTRVAEPQGMQQEMQQLAATFGAQAAYIEPEILKAGGATIDSFVAKEPGLRVYTF
jgi:oligoendopeptidase F